MPTTATPLRTARHRPSLGSVALTLLLVAMLGLVVAVALAPRVAGATPLAVQSDSMQPSLAQGDLVVVRPVAPEQLEVGDVVTFRPADGDDHVVTHRVIELVERQGEIVLLRTQGDAKPYPDDPLTRDQLVGRVDYAVPLAGWVAQRPWALAGVTIGGVVLVAGASLALVGPRATAASAGST